MNEIIIALIGFAGVVFTAVYGNKKTAKTVKEQTSLTLYRIEQLEKKQDKHNTLIERMYDAEERIHVLEERDKVVNHRIKDLEGFHKPQ
jgi:hypothetical protein